MKRHIGILIFAGLLSGCFEGPTQTAGGTSDTGNPSISGVIREKNDAAASGVSVSLYSAFYNPESADTLQVKQSTVTGEDGAYEFADVPEGKYQITAFGLPDSTALLIRDIEVRTGESLGSVSGRLRDMATLTINISELDVSIQGYLYIPGTGISVNITQQALGLGSVTLSGVPAESYSALVYSEREDTARANILTDTLAVLPGQNIEISRYYFWQDTARIYINTSSSGADIPDDVYGFPLLVRLGNTGFDFSSSRSGGAGIRFSKSDGKTPFPHEIENWDSAAGQADIWVRVDTVFGNSSTQFICMFSGSPGAPPLKNPYAGPAVFGPDQGFAGVWHLSESPQDPAPQFPDRSGLNHGVFLDGAGTGASVSGIIHRGAGLNGADQYISTSEVFYRPEIFSVSLWFKSAGMAGGSLMSFSSNPEGISGMDDRHIYMDDSGHVHFGIFPPIPDSVPAEDSSYININPDGLRRIISSPESFNDGSWHHVSAVLSADGQQLFIDGALRAFNAANTTAQDFSGFWRLGYEGLDTWEGKPSNDFFGGVLDEARVRYRADTPSWIKLCYETQKEGSDAVHGE